MYKEDFSSALVDLRGCLYEHRYSEREALDHIWTRELLKQTSDFQNENTFL